VLTKLAETNSTITLGWTPVTDAVGYRFTSEKQTSPSHSWDPNYRRDQKYPACNTRFSKGSAWYKVEVLGVLDVGEYRP